MKTQQQITVSEVKLIYRSKIKASERLKVKCSKDVYDIFMEHWDRDILEHVEQVKLLLLNRSNSVLGIMEISKGGISGTVTDIRIVFQAAIKANASGLILVHNHPSSNINPSESDNKITQKIKEAGILLDISLLDHIIIATDGDYFSYADSGLL
jgi:DNA repair protein RadC